MNRTRTKSQIEQYGRWRWYQFTVYVSRCSLAGTRDGLPYEIPVPRLRLHCAIVTSSKFKYNADLLTQMDGTEIITIEHEEFIPSLPSAVTFAL
jgi:hypothetical protein